MTQHYKTTRRVEFRDTDAAGMVHFSVFFVYLEEAEHELLRHLGLSVMLVDESGPISFPRVAARCDYQRSAKFEDVLDVEAAIVRLGKKSVTFEFNSATMGARSPAARRPPSAAASPRTACRNRSPFPPGSRKSSRLPPSDGARPRNRSAMADLVVADVTKATRRVPSRSKCCAAFRSS